MLEMFYELQGVEIWSDLRSQVVLVAAAGVVDADEAAVFATSDEAGADWTTVTLEDQEKWYALILRSRSRGIVTDLQFATTPTTRLTWALRRQLSGESVTMLAFFTELAVMNTAMRDFKASPSSAASAKLAQVALYHGPFTVSELL